MNIAFVTTESPYNDGAGCGIAAYLKATIPAIVDAGHSVIVFAKAQEEKDFVAEDGRVSVHHFRLPCVHWYAAKAPIVRRFAPLPWRQLEWSLAFYRKVARVHAHSKIDVIESTETGSLFLNRIAPLVIRLHGSERLFREHSGLPMSLSVKWNDSLEAYACDRAFAITTPSQFQTGEIIKHRPRLSDKVQVIPNPISETLLKAAARFGRNGNDQRIVLYTGRLSPVKGIDTLFEAATLTHEIDPSITFVLAGPWQMPKPAEAYGLKANQKSASGIQWVGPQDQNQLIDWYKRASLFVMASNYESFGISAVEAIAFGTPVIATETSGLAEVLGNESLASFLPKGDANALAAKIIESMSSNNGHHPDHDRSRRTIERLRPARVAAETLELYERVRRASGTK